MMGAAAEGVAAPAAKERGQWGNEPFAPVGLGRLAGHSTPFCQAARWLAAGGGAPGSPSRLAVSSGAAAEAQAAAPVHGATLRGAHNIFHFYSSCDLH